VGPIARTLEIVARKDNQNVLRQAPVYAKASPGKQDERGSYRGWKPLLRFFILKGNGFPIKALENDKKDKSTLAYLDLGRDEAEVNYSSAFDGMASEWFCIHQVFTRA
jgi:hypothetical protein